MISLRSTKEEDRYKEYLLFKYDGSCIFCKPSRVKRDFKYWRIRENDFPYDRIASKHHLLSTKRHVADDVLTKEEIEEYNTKVKPYIHKRYDWIIENTEEGRSLPTHYHKHLIVKKK